MNKLWFVYIITNHINSVLYTGITNNLARRVYEHKHKINVSSFSKRYNLYKLIWFQQFNNPKEAIIIEKKIKGWTRKKKLNLIKNTNPNLVDLLR